MKKYIGIQPKFWLLLALILVSLIANSLSSSAGSAYAQGPSRGLFAKAMTTTERDWDNLMSSGWKGVRGELNVDPIMRKMGYELEERYAEHQVFQQGIDAIYRDLKHQRFNVVEAKATSSTERLSLGLLDVRKGGERQMDETWIRKKLDDAYRSARGIIDDKSVPSAQKLSAYRTLGLVEDIKAIRNIELEKTIVITRLNGINPKLTSTLSSDLLAEFTHVIEVGRNGRVLWVHK